MPKENKSSKVEYEKRIRTIQEWIINSYSYVDILKQSVQTWGVSERQAKNYIKVANENFKAANSQKIEDLVIIAIERRKKLARELKDAYKGSPSGILAQLAIEKDIGKLQGLYVSKHELSGPNGKELELVKKQTIIINTQRGTIEYPTE